ncbi:hypothetical protein ABEX25_04240 [Paenibacillus thiaminolyticus]|uniref:ABC transporter substrate-binding protein n=1 Tax=Paenibacillus thiaminolyticus TaxID=49283 RepID=UPI003D2DEE85
MKKIKWLSAILILSVIAAGCGGSGNAGESSAGNGKTTITFLNGFTGGDGGYMKKITDGFNSSQDKYFIKEMQEKDHYTKFKSGNYDLVVIHANNLQTYKMDGMIQNITPVMEKAGLQESDFHPAAADLARLDGSMYGLPLDIHPLTMFYNKKLVAEAPQTYADLAALNAELQAKDKNLFAAGVPSSGIVEFYIMTIAAQNGIQLQQDNYLNFNQPAFADALLTFHDMIWKDKLSPAGLGLDGEFQAFMKEAQDANASVQTAVALTGPWFYGAAKDKFGDQLGIGPVPQLGAEQAVYGNGHIIAVPAGVKDDKVLEGIAEYLKYMFTTENLIHWADAGQAPAHVATMSYIEENQDQYPLSYANQQQFETYVKAPQVYQFGEQMRYMNEKVFSTVVLTENLSKDELMQELETATENAKQIAATQP